MYFEIDNTPEAVKRERKKRMNESEERTMGQTPTLRLAPFGETPVITFDRILLGQTHTRHLRLHNPTDNTLQICISKFPPDDLNLHVSWTEICVDSKDTCDLELIWKPIKEVAQKFNIQFTDHKKRRYDTTVIFKSISNKTINGKGTTKKQLTRKPVVLKKSPKRLSPRKVTMIKKSNFLKADSALFCDTVITKPIMKREINHRLPMETSVEDEDLAKAMRRETYCIADKKLSSLKNTPSIFTAIDDLKFTPMKKINTELNESSDKENTCVGKSPIRMKVNDLEVNVDNIVANMNFTPLRCDSRLKRDNIKPKQVFSVNTEYTADSKGDMIPSNILRERQISNVQIFKPETGTVINVTHSIIDLENDAESIDAFGKKPNITFENSFTPEKSFESNLVFDPKRCSTERKKESSPINLSPVIKDTLNITYDRLSSDTYIKEEESLFLPAESEKNYSQSSPFSMSDKSPIIIDPPPTHRSTFSKKLPFSDSSTGFQERAEMRNLNKEKNFTSSIQNIIGADLWQKNTQYQSNSPTSLSMIPEEPSIITIKDMSHHLNTKEPFETFILNKTFDKHEPTVHKSRENQSWMKTAVRHDPITKLESKLKIFESAINEDFEYINIKSMATTVDPFMTATCLYDERAFEELENEFKMWLNYLLTPPAEFDTESENKQVDIGKVWIENRNKNIPLAPTKEQVSSKYHTSHRLESLRRAAKVFISSPQITEILLKISNQIDRKILAIRVDKNIHLDIGLQKIILHLLKCYNPLWLRIGLETIYDKNIKLSSNDDFLGLSEFITDNLFKDSYISTKHSSTAMSNIFLPSYAENIKRFTLKKFLFLVYFLDKAKESKIIPHDPCLFRRNAPFKESREILIQFAKEVLAGVGDITKHLKPTGYVVTHKQSFLNEFKYAVHNLAVDLKDGIRLTRLMEIILMQNNLLSSIRAPAISRLQKVHNVKVALTALESAGFKIVGDITPKDIADGHREKTLSLLWQLINKFRAPLFEKAALVLQKWWRRKMLRVTLEKRIQYKKMLVFHNAATVIQTKWRQTVCRRLYLDILKKKTKACVHIQKTWKMYKARSVFIKWRSSAVVIQNWYRERKAIEAARKNLISRRENRAAIMIQRWFRKVNRKIIGKSCEERQAYLEARKSAICLQRAFRARLEMKKYRNMYIIIRERIIKIQQIYRAIILRRKERKQYLQLKQSTIVIQQIFRANMEMRRCLAEFNRKKNAIVTIQRHFRGHVLKKQQQEYYQLLRKSSIILQQRFRAQVLMKVERNNYLELRRSTLILQKYYRARLQMKQARNSYLKQKKSATIIQRSFRSYMEKKRRLNAVIKIQRFYRNQKLTIETKQNYLQIKMATILIQRQFRALQKMKVARKQYLIWRTSTITIQNRFRALIEMRKQREIFLKMKNAVVKIQKFYRLFKFQQRRINAAVCIQTHYKNYKLSKNTHNDYLKKKTAAIVIQQHFRAWLLAKSSRKNYLLQLKSAVQIQRAFRSYKIMKSQKADYLEMKKSAIFIQRFYRRHLRNKKENNAAIVIQKYYKNYKLNKSVRCEFLQLKRYSIFIQQRRRFILHVAQKRFNEQNNAACAIQKYFRAYTARCKYLKLKVATLAIQRRYRANQLCRKARNDYQLIKQSTIIIQIRYRALHNMRIERQKYQSLRNAAIVIQQRYRAKREMVTCMDYFETQKCAAVQIQTWYRSIIWIRKIRAAILKHRELERHRNATIIQSYWKGYMARNYFYTVRFASIMIQTWYKSILKMRTQRLEYLRARAAAIEIQSRWRCYRARREFLLNRERIILIQRTYRSWVEMKKDLYKYNRIKRAVVLIQALSRGYLMRKKAKEMLRNYKEAQWIRKRNASAIIIQRFWRGYDVRKRQAEDCKEAELRKRWRNGGLISKQPTLAERSEDAMNVLLHFRDISSIIRAFKTLDYVTNVNPMMYESEDLVRPIVSRLVLYIDSTNRSVSTLETIQLAVSVLVNLAKYKPTSQFVFNEANMNVFLKLLLKWCDKDSLLSRLLCTLVWVLAKYELIYEEIFEMLTQPENYKILCRVRSLLVRKKRMDSRKRSSITPRKEPPSRMSITPVKMGRPPPRPDLPWLEPDYGVIQGKRQRIFMDDIHAIESVFFKYKLELNIVNDTFDHK